MLNIADYNKTTLAGSMEVFEKFLKNMEATWKGKLIEQSGWCWHNFNSLIIHYIET